MKYSRYNYYKNDSLHPQKKEENVTPKNNTNANQKAEEKGSVIDNLSQISQFRSPERINQ